MQRKGAGQAGGDDFPLLQMIAAQEAGAGSLSDFLDWDGMEYKRWVQYIQRGPSQLRTQILLAQLIQIVAGFAGAKGITMEKMLPYYSTLVGGSPEKAKHEKGKKQRQANVDRILDDYLKGAK